LLERMPMKRLLRRCYHCSDVPFFTTFAGSQPWKGCELGLPAVGSAHEMFVNMNPIMRDRKRWVVREVL
jgi:hypothetical protein